ncbi:GPI ethanolamine phosphate transferase 1 isoform X2 [Neocloeon triangulifer]|uniref:GPI ethanolamine phosphate transferase 1 isoform X2 n=1 Tax=Neocloeon triangulifer TaxID=2078957 RepID=UPI00286F3A1A|nr:GPI ethanolamine phosphate transferase 1 isoform X2 [Neocloeon triangulifer]
MKLIFCGVLVHSLFLASIFDIYFNSPVLHGIEAFHPSFEPAAQRLVLFVADGLRANSFYSNSDYSPYLRSIIETRGSWGVSHTRVPTESRPGHVAMIAGLYEDPSAVAKGWKENPVEFDSVFNRSSHTWAWGSADILPMFAKGEASGRVTTFTYPKIMQRFSGDGSNEKLDTWVFERVERFFKWSGKTDQKVQEKGVVFFLHLLGIDTAGHDAKPHSKTYLKNINLVDQGIHRIEKEVEKYFNNDGKTVYVFTSDHGMTDWGSHGAGSLDETETPLVAWGAGIKGPEKPRSPKESPSQWGLDYLDRKDVNQADIAALMSALLAVPTPTNNVGIVPKEYFEKGSDWIAKAVMSNLQQILLQFERAKFLVHEKVFSLLIVPYAELSSIDQWIVELKNGNHTAVVNKATVVYQVALEGIVYYQNYFGRSLKFSITISHILWMAYLLTRLICKPRIHSRNSLILDLTAGISMSTILLLILAQKLPLQYVMYYSLPVILLWFILRDCDLWWPQVAPVVTKNFFGLLIVFGLTILAIGCLVMSFFERAVLSMALLVISVIPLFGKLRGSKLHWAVASMWTLACIALAIFPLLPVVGKEANYTFVFAAGIATSILSIFYVIFFNIKPRWLTLGQSVLVAISSTNVLWTSSNYDDGLGLTITNQITSWAILGLSLALPLFAHNTFISKIVSLSLSISMTFVLLSVRHEALFLLFFHIMLNLYPLVEFNVSSVDQFQLISTRQMVVPKLNGNQFLLADLCRAYFYLFCMILAFFGVGNIASMNSFDPTWVRAFVSTFSPFLMGGLIVFKTALPFIAVAACIASVSFLVQRPIQWLLVLGMCDMMALPFFHLVRTEGSWLDIGQSISHFVIAHVCVLFLLIIHSGVQAYLQYDPYKVWRKMKGFI